MKTIWISALSQDQARVAAVTQHLKRYGLQCKGHFWDDKPDNMAWRPAVAAALAAKADMWLVLADDASLALPGVRYGLGLMGSALRAARDAAFPVVMLWEATPPTNASLPQLLQPVTLLSEELASWQAKIVARINMPLKIAAADYRLDILGDDRLGQWFEVGPRTGSWNGVMFGVAGGEAQIDFQAVGPLGALPDKSVLECAQQGLQVEVAGRVFTAWAVRNSVDAASSYYARVKGSPEALLFMPYSEDSEGEAVLVSLL